MTPGIVEIIGPEGDLIGTGFVGGGHVITCHHVATLGSISIRDAAGNTLQASLVEDDELARSDLALLAIDAVAGVLAIEPADAVPAELLLRGFGLNNLGYRSSVPVRAAVAGSTSIAYAKDARSYQLDGVWKLDRADIAPGFSGGPALDVEGVAVGVTVAQLAGRSTAFVVPFARVATAARFVALLEDNRRRVPRGGAHADARAAIAALVRQCAGAVDWLRQLRMFVDEWSVVRAEAVALCVRFLTGAAHVLPVIGPSGTGKTFLLAQLASSTTLPSLLLLARDIKPTWDLEDAVSDALAGDRVDVPRCLRRLRDNGRWAIFLDGLNELPLPIEQIRTWFLRAGRWAQGAGAALVVSCRSEFWQVLERSLPDAWCDRVASAPPRGEVQARPLVISLGAFTLDEATQARRSYRLASDWAELREPALLRVAAELVARARPVARWDVIDAFLRQRCEAVARAIGLARSPLAIVTVLEDLAGRYLAVVDRGSAPIEVAESVLGGDHALLQALIDEGLLIRRERTIRFAFDWIAEHLQGRGVDVGAALAAYDPEQPATGALLCAGLEHALHDGKLEAVTRTLDALVGRVRRDAELVAVLRALSGSFDLVEKGLAAVVQRRKHQPDPDVYHFVAAAPFSIAQRIELARALVPHTAYWPWRRKDRELQPRFFESGSDLFHVFRTLLAEDAVATASSLISWLGDNTRMRDNEGSVDDVATAVVLQADTLAHAAVVDRLALAWPRTRSVLDDLARGAPAQLAGDLRRWHIETGRSRGAAVDGLIEQLVSVRPELIDVATDAFRGNGDESLAAQLVLQGGRDDDVWRACERAAREGRVSAWKVVPLLASRFDDVMAWLEEAAARSKNHARDVTTALSHAELSEGGLARLTAILERSRESDPYGVARIVEDLLRRIAPATATALGLWSLAVGLVDAGDGPRSCMKYFAYGVAVERVEPTLQEEMARLLAGSADGDELGELVAVAAGNGNRYLPIPLAEGVRRGDVPGARGILIAGRHASDRSSPIVVWARAHGAALPSVARWLVGVDAGENPRLLAADELAGLDDA